MGKTNGEEADEQQRQPLLGEILAEQTDGTENPPIENGIASQKTTRRRPAVKNLVLNYTECDKATSQKKWNMRTPLDCESLDYETVQNKVSINKLRKQEEQKKEQKKQIYGYTGRTFAKFTITIVAGIVIGLLAIGISLSTKKLTIYKNGLIQKIFSGSNFGLAMFAHLGYSAVLVIFAISLVQFYAPAAAGSGVSLVIAYLNGNHVPNLFTLRTLVTKFVGTICAIAANLFMGPEGPMVHMGAAVVSVLTYMEFCWCCMIRAYRPEKFVPECTSAENGELSENSKPIFTPVSVEENQNLGYFTSKWIRFWDFMMDLGSDLDRREFLSAGAAAGIAAAFGAPVGGVLFSMEEASTYWSRKVAWRCFLCATAAVMTQNWLMPIMEHHCNKDNEKSEECDSKITGGMLSFEKGVELGPGDWLRQTPMILVISIIAGLLGVAFNSMRIALWRVRASRKKSALRILEGVALAAITVVVMFTMSNYLGNCHKISKNNLWESEHAFIQFNCENTQGKKKHNDLASAFMATPEVTIRRLFSLGSGDDEDPTIHDGKKYLDMHFSMRSLAIFIPTYLIVMSLGAGIAIPGGLFMPAIMLGATTGALYGRLILVAFQKLDSVMESSFYVTGKIEPGFYAVLGAVGCLASVFRSSISLVVIVVEGTRNIDYLFGVIIAVVISNWVAQHVHHDGVYENEIERAGNVHFLRPEPPRALFFKTADEVMASDLHGFAAIEQVGFVIKVLRDTTHNGFPVFAIEEHQNNTGRKIHGRLEGMILRSQLLVLLRRRIFCDAHGIPIRPITEQEEEEVDLEMRRFYRLYQRHHRFMATQDIMLDALELDWAVHSPGEGQPMPLPESSNSNHDHPEITLKSIAKKLFIDLRPYMNHAPLTVRKECNAARVYQAFTSLGLRHLCVVDDYNEVVGLITRKDLDHAAGRGPWRTTKRAPSPQQHGIFIRRITSTINRFGRKLPTLLRRPCSESNLQTLTSGQVVEFFDDNNFVSPTDLEGESAFTTWSANSEP